MASKDYQIVLIIMTISIAINIWLYKVSVKLDGDNRRLAAINARYQAYQDGWFDK
jgi:divalent metal cation (Fe/Co/Zn/Cd) transporter